MAFRSAKFSVMLRRFPAWQWMVTRLPAVENRAPHGVNFAIEMGKMSRAAAAAMMGVNPSASEAEVKKAFKAFALKYHPDKADLDALQLTKEEAGASWFCWRSLAWR